MEFPLLSSCSIEPQNWVARSVLQAMGVQKCQPLAEFDFTFPKKISKPKIFRLFDLQFVESFRCAVFLGATGLGKTLLLTALGYAACEKGISVRLSRGGDRHSRR